MGVSVKAKSSKKGTGKKIVKNVENLMSKERHKPLDFAMSGTERAIEDKKAMKNIPLEGEKKKQEDLIKSFKGFTFDNTSIVQNELVILLLDSYRPIFDDKYVMCYAKASDYNIFAAKENPRVQEFSETAKSVLGTIVKCPNKYLRNTSSYAKVICDYFEIKENPKRIVLKGNIQIIDGATRSQLIEELKRIGGFETYLEQVVFPFSIKLRSDYESDVDFASDCVASNTSKQVGYYERAYGYGCFDTVPARFGKYADRIALKKSDAKGGKVYFYDLLSFVGSMNCTKYVNQNVSDISGLIHYTHKYCSKGYFEELISAKERYKEDFNADLYFDFLDDIGEDLFELYMYLNNEFFEDIQRYIADGVLTSSIQDKLMVLVTGNNFKAKGKNTWNQIAERMIYNTLRYLLRESSEGKYYFIYNPIKILKKKRFYTQLIITLYQNLTIGENNFKDKKRVKVTGLESRDADAAADIYEIMGECINEILG